MSDKILLVSYYWYPFNTAGSFRWLHLSNYLSIHSLITSKKPCKGFIDTTMPRGKIKVIIRLFKLPAILWGIIITPIVLIYSLFFDKIIFTIPPESLLLPAWICQLFGGRVYIDMRDSIDRPTQPNKWFISVYNWLYRRIKNACVTMQCFDPTKPVIRHGYDNIKKSTLKLKNVVIQESSFNYQKYCLCLRNGMGRDYGESFDHYTSSSVITLRHLGNPIKGNLHPELFEFEPQSWEEISKDMAKFLGISSESPSCLKRYSECLYQDYVIFIKRIHSFGKK